MNKSNKIYTRILMAVAGIIILGISVGLTQYATLGVDPFTSFVTGIGNMVGFPFSKIYPIITDIIIAVIFLFDKKLLGIITFLNMLLIGPLADFSREKIADLVPNPSNWESFLILGLGLILMGLGVSLCNNSDLGTGPYDTLSLILADKADKLDFKFARIIIYVTSVVFGLIGRADVGGGTVVNIIARGYIIAFLIKIFLKNFMLKNNVFCFIKH